MSKIKYNKCDLLTLVQMSQSGKIKALEELIKRVQKEVFAVFLHLVNKRSDVSDLTQETLIKMARSIDKLNNPARFKPWLNQIITNVFYDHVRKKTHSEVELEDEKLHEIKDKIGCEPGEKCFFSEMEKLIQAALMTLPKDLRITLVLREYEGLSYEDIAKITNTAIGTVKSRISRARLKLQKELKEFI